MQFISVELEFIPKIHVIMSGLYIMQNTMIMGERERMVAEKNEKLRCKEKSEKGGMGKKQIVHCMSKKS